MLIYIIYKLLIVQLIKGKAKDVMNMSATRNREIDHHSLKHSILGTGRDLDLNTFNDLHIDEIRGEYKRIDNNWLHLHYKISIVLVIFALMVECLMALILVNSDMLSTTVGRYIEKFILAPSGINIIWILIATMVMRSKRISQNQKIYAVSLILVAVCFVLFVAHNAFVATYYLFAVAIILTTIYVNYYLTFITALTSIAALIGAELFVKWDIDKIGIFESTLRMGDFLISISILIACSFICMIKIRYEKQKNEASIRKEMERQLLTQRIQRDELTGAYSRKALHDALRDMEANETNETFIFAIADIDNFKNVNDNLGHHAGDLCLIEFTKILKASSGKSKVFRYGGDEFCLLFCNADISEAVSTCEQIRQKLKELCFDEYPTLQLSVSFGLAAYSESLNAARLFINADQALYEAKKDRDTIRVFQ